MILSAVCIRRLESHSSTSGTPQASPLEYPPDSSFMVAPPAATLGVQSSFATSDHEPQLPRYGIRTDAQYDPVTKVLTASMELPGMKKSDLKIALSTCIVNRVRQISVSGILRPFFPQAVSNSVASVMAGSQSRQVTVRERKYGEYRRTFAVPAETKVRTLPLPSSHVRLLLYFFYYTDNVALNGNYFLLFSSQREDIDATMEDGILIMKIRYGEPALSEDRHELPID